MKNQREQNLRKNNFVWTFISEKKGFYQKISAVIIFFINYPKFRKAQFLKRWVKFNLKDVCFGIWFERLSFWNRSSPLWSFICNFKEKIIEIFIRVFQISRFQKKKWIFVLFKTIMILYFRLLNLVVFFSDSLPVLSLWVAPFFNFSVQISILEIIHREISWIIAETHHFFLLLLWFCNLLTEKLNGLQTVAGVLNSLGFLTPVKGSVGTE